MANDDTLIHRAQAGDEGAFAVLMREHYPFVYAIVIRIVKNSHDAEEVVQDAFLNAYRGLTQLKETTKFKSWLGEIAQNCGRNWLRKQRGDTVSIDEVGEQMLQTEDSSGERLIWQEQRELIRRTMETLPQKDREIAQAFYLEGASYDELTNAHGLSYNAIAFRLSRAKRQLTKRLQYLLTGIFVSPATTLKKLYSGGLTVMKIGTVPKVTAGVATLIALIFIGFIGVRQMTAPTVEERVYLSPWEDGTERPRKNSEDLALQTDPAQGAENGDSRAEITTEGLELVDDFSGQFEETNTTQFTAEAEFESEMDQSFFADISTLLDDEGRSAEDVMNAYLEAYRSVDTDTMRSVLTGSAKEGFENGMMQVWNGNGELSQDLIDFVDGLVPREDVEVADEILRQVKESMLPNLKRRNAQAEIASSEHVGDEFHFRIRIPVPKGREIPGVEMPKLPDSVTPIRKMRKENGRWRIYYSQ